MPKAAGGAGGAPTPSLEDILKGEINEGLNSITSIDNEFREILGETFFWDRVVHILREEGLISSNDFEDAIRELREKNYFVADDRIDEIASKLYIEIIEYIKSKLDHEVSKVIPPTKISDETRTIYERYRDQMIVAEWLGITETELIHLLKSKGLRPSTIRDVLFGEKIRGTVTNKVFEANFHNLYEKYKSKEHQVDEIIKGINKEIEPRYGIDVYTPLAGKGLLEKLRFLWEYYGGVQKLPEEKKKDAIMGLYSSLLSKS